MPQRTFKEAEQFQRILGQVLESAAARSISQGELARRAGVTPETLSRMKSRGDGSFGLVVRLARITGLRLTLIPDDAVLESIHRGTFF